jgi:hypothetical protein
MSYINLFWDKQPLTKLENLSLLSYSNYCRDINIFTYDESIFKDYRRVFKVINANEIIPEQEKFYYSGNGDCPSNSVVGFSDIFRYKLLYDVGGWYSDFDVTCLNSFDIYDHEDTVLRPHYKYGAISNICKFKQGDAILKVLYDTTVSEIHNNNNNWCKPLEIFDKVIKDNKYQRFVVDKGIFGNDNFNESTHHLLNSSMRDVDISGMLAIHWCRSAITTGQWSSSQYYDTDNPAPGTLLSLLYTKYGLNV